MSIEAWKWKDIETVRLEMLDVILEEVAAIDERTKEPTRNIAEDSYYHGKRAGLLSVYNSLLSIHARIDLRPDQSKKEIK